jgi:hypothetical protein
MLEEFGDPDLWYLAGATEASKNNLSKANEYFKQGLRCKETQKSILITETSDALFEILYMETKERDSELI